MSGVHTQIFATEQPATLTAVLVHGASDHSGRYAHVIEKLNASGISVITGDLPGFGRSAGLHGHIDRFDQYLDAVEQWVQQAKAQGGTAGHVILIGHSMGGLVVLRFLQERGHDHPQLVKAVLSSPLLRVAVEIPPWKRTIAKMLDRLLPKLRMPSGIDTAFLSRTPDVVAAYAQDPLCGGVVSARWYQEIVRASESARNQAGKVGVPILLMQAGQDRLVAPEEAEPFFQKVPGRENSRFIHYPQCYHELFNEPEREEIMREMIEWVAKP